MFKQVKPENTSDKRRFWETHLRAWRKSGLTQASYCRQYDLAVHRFIYWKKRVRRPEPSVTFVPVAPRLPLEPTPSADSIRLVVDKRFEITVGDGFSPATLEKLIRTLGDL